MIVGLGLARSSALGTSVAFLLKQRGAVLAPPVSSAASRAECHGPVPVPLVLARLGSLGSRPSARSRRGGYRVHFGCANLAAIMGGILVFRDPVGVGPLAVIGRVIAFGRVTAGAALMPGPLRAGRAPGLAGRLAGLPV
jgi:hypothetical protein